MRTTYAALALLLPACSAGVANGARETASPAATPPVVEIRDYAFSPKTLTVPTGTTVTWIERDEDLAGKGAHNVVGEAFASEPFLAKGAAFTTTFAKAGTYAYHCGIHNYMTGTITVA